MPTFNYEVYIQESGLLVAKGFTGVMTRDYFRRVWLEVPSSELITTHLDAEDNPE